MNDNAKNRFVILELVVTSATMFLVNLILFEKNLLVYAEFKEVMAVIAVGLTIGNLGTNLTYNRLFNLNKFDERCDAVIFFRTATIIIILFFFILSNNLNWITIALLLSIEFFFRNYLTIIGRRELITYVSLIVRVPGLLFFGATALTNFISFYVCLCFLKKNKV